MALPTPVNGQITDAVTQANVKVLADGPALAMGAIYQSLAHSTGILYENAVSSQLPGAMRCSAPSRDNARASSKPWPINGLLRWRQSWRYRQNARARPLPQRPAPARWLPNPTQRRHRSAMPRWVKRDGVNPWSGCAAPWRPTSSP